MLTILTRIFPYDIGEYIYKIYKNDALEVIMYPKLYTLELILDNFISLETNEYMHFWNKIIINIDGIRFIKRVFQSIKKYNYNVDNIINTKIIKFVNIFKCAIKEIDEKQKLLYIKLYDEILQFN